MTKLKAPERLLHYFLDREGKPVSTFTLERIAGRRGWRSRVSEARKLARLLRRTITNTQPRVYRRGKLVAITSFYTLVKVPRKAA